MPEHEINAPERGLIAGVILRSVYDKDVGWIVNRSRQFLEYREMLDIDAGNIIRRVRRMVVGEFPFPKPPNAN